MPEEDKALSQAEIDALLGNISSGGLVPAQEEAASAPVATAAPPAAKVNKPPKPAKVKDESPTPSEGNDTGQGVIEKLRSFVKKSKPSTSTQEKEHDEDEVDESASTRLVILQRLKSLISRSDSSEFAIEDGVLLVAQRIAKVETSVDANVDRIRKLQTNSVDLDSIHDRLDKIESSQNLTIEQLAQPKEPETPAVDFDSILSRIDKIEVIDYTGITKRIADLEATVANNEAANARADVLARNVQSLQTLINKMQSDMNDLSTTQKGTLNSGIHSNFVCKACKARGFVASQVRCTNCGKQTWQGWWYKD